MPACDLPLLIDAAHEAGDVARSFAGITAARWEKPEGAGPVTEADLAVNDTLASKLRAARPDYGWLSEESEDDAARLSCDRVFIIDPIDGTRSFIEGSGTWAHALAVAEKGQVTAAVIYMPLRDKLYTAAHGQGASLNGVPIHVGGQSDLDAATLLTVRASCAPDYWQGGRVPGFKRAYRPSLAYRLALVAEGRFDAMLTFRKTWEWDVAAGDLILREAGAVTSDRTDELLTFNNAIPRLNGVLAANPELYRQITKALA